VGGEGGGGAFYKTWLPKGGLFKEGGLKEKGGWA